MHNIFFKSIQFSKFLRTFFILLGAFFSISIILSFTTLPFWGYHWLGTSKSELKSEPEIIIFMGGGGMPSPSNLMRCWYTSEAWSKFPKSSVVIAVPGNVLDSLSTPVRIKTELILRGVDPSKVIFENKGTNTRSQALNSSKLMNATTPILLVTSPEHMRRSVLSFKKVGFSDVSALPAFSDALEANLHFKDDDLGGNKNFAPDVGNKLSLRYQIWSHLKYEILITREFIALLYYKIRGWI